MKTTSTQVLDKLYSLVKGSALEGAVKGALYKKPELRPANRVNEDIVLNFVSGDAEQIQEGVANVNVFVPDIDAGLGIPVCNTTRCRELEAVAAEWAESLRESDGYYFELDEIIETLRYEDNKQHLLNIRLKFNFVTF